MALGHASEGAGPGDVHMSQRRHPGGVNLLFAEGHVAFLRTSLGHTNYLVPATRAGGEVVSVDAYRGGPVPIRTRAPLPTARLLPASCGSEEVGERRTPLPLDRVPEAVLKAAKAKLPGYTFGRVFTI
jgi:prepilin-type processing-associated H-X9-DG protein